ncbi:MAG: LptF/LptG family permease [Desulfobulbaceae bacterium]|nr:LptF/LptG family permease [Desulfobulbaceae bacterium]
MKKLNAYILTQFIKNISMIIAGFIGIYMLIDFFEKIDNFMEKGKSMGLVAKFFLFNIPFILEQLGPVCILLAGVITLGILNHSNELIALKASGIPLRKIVAPIIAAGVVVSMLLLTISQFILPKTITTTNKIWNEEVRGLVPLGIFRNGRYYYQSGNAFYSFVRPDLQKHEYLQFSYSTWDDDYRLSSLVASERAVWNDGEWLLLNGQMQTVADNETYETDIFIQRSLNLPDNPDDFFISQYRSLELSLTGLFLEAKRKTSKAEADKAWSEFYGRLFYILLGLPLLLLGLPMLLIIYRKWGRDLSLAIPVSCGLAFVSWGLWGTLQSLAKASYMNPLLAASTVHILVGLAGIYLLLREDA